MKWNQISDARRILSRETGTVVKDWGGKLAVALIYPNTYHVGMSSLGMQTLYRLFNERSDVVCERAFYSGLSLSQHPPPPVSIETQRPLTDFSLIAFTLSYEMDYFNVVQMLVSAGIPVLSQERDDRWPLIVSGGPAVSSNPEPLALFFDAICIGEGEEIIGQLADACIGDHVTRDSTLAAWSKIPGMYVPGVSTNESTSRIPVQRQWVRDLALHPTHSVVLTPDTEFGNLYLIEIARGCGRGCRFCLAGYLYRPPRERPVEMLLEQALVGMGYRDRIGLVSAATSDYGRIEDLVDGLRRLGARFSVSSLRADSLSETLVKALSESGAQTLTIAPEAGDECLREVINKTQSETELLQAVTWADTYHLPQLKLYFMVGHPSETDQDMDSLVNLVLEARARFPRNLAVNLTPFVPKPHTPFQWAEMAAAGTVRARQAYVKRELRGRRVDVKSDSAAWAEVQGVLARGDRRLANVLLSMDRVSLPAWRRAMAENGLTPEEFLRHRSLGEALPWQVVDSGVNDAFLRREWRLSQSGRSSISCPPGAQGCVLCGACDDRADADRAQGSPTQG